MGRKYSREELEALKSISEDHGSICYCNEYDIEKEFYDKTGGKRKSGPLYMAAWRINNGIYDHLLN